MSRSQQKQQPVQSDLLSRPSPARREIIQRGPAREPYGADARLGRWTRNLPWNQEPINTSATSTPKAVKHQEQMEGN
jgi:hypothetical protein